MSWWGKLFGGAFGFMLGGPLGALIGAALGHSFDKGLSALPQDEAGFAPGDQERVQTAFFTATFSVMGHVAKADGQVSEDEIALARSVMAQMDLGLELQQAAMRLFGEGKRAGFPLDEVLDQFRQECRRRQTLIQMFLEVQLQAAYADGHLDPAEQRLLLHICDRLGFPRQIFRRLEDMVSAHYRYTGSRRGATQPTGPSIADAYALLGLDAKASDTEVKRSYRRLLSQHHPDKLVSKGLPQEMMKMAADKTHEIRQAYERIRKQRGF